MGNPGLKSEESRISHSIDDERETGARGRYKRHMDGPRPSGRHTRDVFRLLHKVSGMKWHEWHACVALGRIPSSFGRATYSGTMSGRQHVKEGVTCDETAAKTCSCQSVPD